MSNTSSRGVDEVALKTNISKWNSCTKVINDQITNLDNDERLIYEELYAYWRTASFDKSYCKGKIEALKPYDKFHKGALLSANQEFRRRATFFYVDSENNFKAFQEEMKAVMGSTPPPVATPAPAPAQPTQPQQESIDDMVLKWRQIVKVVKENSEALTVVEQTCFEQLSDFHRTSADYDPSTCSELITTFIQELKKRNEKDSVYIIMAQFLRLCIYFYTEAEDIYFEFQNTVRPRSSRQTSRSTSGATTAPHPAQTTVSRSTSTLAPTGSTSSTASSATSPATENESSIKSWQDNAFTGIVIAYGLYVIYSFWAEGFWGGIWDSIKMGIAAFILAVIIFTFKSLTKCIITIVIIALVACFFYFKDDIKSDDKSEPTVSTEQLDNSSSDDSVAEEVHDESSSKPKAATTKPQNQSQSQQANTSVEPAVLTADVMPRFNGNDHSTFPLWVASKVSPKSTISGRCVVDFIIEKDGSLSSLNVATSSNKALTSEVQKIIKSAPKWSAGSNKGKAVRVKFTTPIVVGGDTKTTNTTTSSSKTSTASSTSSSTSTTATPKTAEEYYESGVNLAKQFKESEAVKSLTKAVEMGSVDAMYYLGMMYVNGGENTAEGFNLVLKAANAGHKEATFQVAELYNAGTGTEKSKTQAKSWYQKAEALGDSRATSRLRKL